MNGSCALTTFDNPYNPFEQFSDWFLFDVEISTAKQNKIASMNASGYSTSEIAEALGISTSTVSNYLN